MKKLTLDEKIELKLIELGFSNYTLDKGRLMAAELMLKVSGGFYISHSENLFIRSIGVLTSKGTPNKNGFRFLVEMFYASSNKRPEAFYLMKDHRRE